VDTLELLENRENEGRDSKVNTADDDCFKGLKK
jgi:hypothetical protein